MNQNKSGLFHGRLIKQFKMPFRLIRFYFLPLLSGALMGLSFMPFPPWALFFCYVPLWLFAIKRRSFKELFIGGWLSQFVGTLIGFNWLAGAIHEFEILPWSWSLLSLLVFASLANLHIPIALGLWMGSEKALNYTKAFLRIPSLWGQKAGPFRRTFLFPSCLFLLPIYSALAMEYYFLIFKWHFGYTWLYAGWPAFQTAEIWGFQFLNSLTLFFNFLFFLAFKSLRSSFFAGDEIEPSGASSQSLIGPKISPWRWIFSQAIKTKSTFVPLSVGLALFCALNIYGLFLKSRWPEADKKAVVLLIQPHVENHKQGKEEWDDFILSQLLQETSLHLWPERQRVSFSEGEASAGLKVLQKEGPAGDKKKIDFILWPEGGYPYSIDKELALKGRDPIQKWPTVFNFPLIVSAEGRGKGRQTNSIFVFDRKGRLVQGPYDKMLLMPFGEKAPFAKRFPQFSQSLFRDITFDKGDGDNKVIYLNGLNLGFQICYESLFERLTRDLSQEGADILINVANDSWFGKWQEPWQNLYMTLARAVEIRRPLIRGTNSGLSAVISAKGDLIHLGALAQKGAWLIEVPYSSKRESQPVFVYWGHLINPLFLWLSLIISLFSLILFPSGQKRLS